MNTGKPLPLRGLGIVVTRPAHQAETLCRLIEAQGGEAIRFPTLEILPPRDSSKPVILIERLDDYDMIIFTSANAVSYAMNLILERRRLPPHLKLAAIGRATARELERCGTPAHCFPEHTFNSEALLALPEMQAVAGQRIIIFRGEGGRDLLINILKERGAIVTYAEVYRRRKPETRPDELLQRWREGKIQVIIVTSNENLRNLFDLVGEFGQQWLCNTPLIVVSERTRELAQKLGFNYPPLVTREASDEAIIEALLSITPN